MKIHEAILLLRNKFLEEQRGVSESLLASQYQSALKEFPAVMAVAHHIFAGEVTKTS
jgi:hypothetical protein